MIYVIAFAIVIIATMSTVLIIKRYNGNPFYRKNGGDIYEYTDQELLYALDSIVIKYHSMELVKLEKLLAKKGEHMAALYWCDLMRLYAFSSENEVFRSFLNGLEEGHWQGVFGAYRQLSLGQALALAEDIYSCKNRISLEQSEHFRYSIREANGRMQAELCSHIRDNIEHIK